MPTRSGNAIWKGDLQGGDGHLTVGDGVFEGAYTFKSRFEEGEGTNPEELIGAAQAGCFSMFLSKVLADAGHPSTSIETTANVHLEPVDGKQTVTRIELSTTAEVPSELASSTTITS